MVLDENEPDMVMKVNNLQKAIRGDYRHNWIIDNLPAASLMETDVGYGSCCCCCLWRLFSVLRVY